MAEKTLRERGLEIRRRLWPDREGGIAVFRALDPGFSDFILEHAYGGIYGDPTLDLRTRSLLTCAALTALGRARALRNHLRGALNIGITQAELVAMIKQIALYGGFPVAHDAFAILKDILDERNAAPPQ